MHEERKMGIKVQEKRKEGRPKMRCFDSVRAYIREKGLSGEKVHNQAAWRHMSSIYRPT